MREHNRIICSQWQKKNIYLNKLYNISIKGLKVSYIAPQIKFICNATPFGDKENTSKKKILYKQSNDLIYKTVTTVRTVFVLPSLYKIKKNNLVLLSNLKSSNFVSFFSHLLTLKRNKMISRIHFTSMIQLVYVGVRKNFCESFVWMKKSLYIKNIFNKLILSIFSPFLGISILFKSINTNAKRLRLKGSYISKLSQLKLQIRNIFQTVFIFVLPIIIYRINNQFTFNKNIPCLANIIYKSSDSYLLNSKNYQETNFGTSKLNLVEKKEKQIDSITNKNIEQQYELLINRNENSFKSENELFYGKQPTLQSVVASEYYNTISLLRFNLFNNFWHEDLSNNALEILGNNILIDRKEIDTKEVSHSVYNIVSNLVDLNILISNAILPQNSFRNKTTLLDFSKQKLIRQINEVNLELKSNKLPHKIIPVSQIKRHNNISYNNKNFSKVIIESKSYQILNYDFFTFCLKNINTMFVQIENTILKLIKPTLFFQELSLNEKKCLENQKNQEVSFFTKSFQQRQNELVLSKNNINQNDKHLLTNWNNFKNFSLKLIRYKEKLSFIKQFRFTAVLRILNICEQWLEKNKEIKIALKYFKMSLDSIFYTKNTELQKNYLNILFNTIRPFFIYKRKEWGSSYIISSSSHKNTFYLEKWLYNANKTAFKENTGNYFTFLRKKKSSFDFKIKETEIVECSNINDLENNDGSQLFPNSSTKDDDPDQLTSLLQILLLTEIKNRDNTVHKVLKDWTHSIFIENKIQIGIHTKYILETIGKQNKIVKNPHVTKLVLMDGTLFDGIFIKNFDLQFIMYKFKVIFTKMLKNLPSLQHKKMLPLTTVENVIKKINCSVFAKKSFLLIPQPTKEFLVVNSLCEQNETLSPYLDNEDIMILYTSSNILDLANSTSFEEYTKWNVNPQNKTITKSRIDSFLKTDQRFKSINDLYLFNQKYVLKRYKLWAFTSQWWQFITKTLVNTFPFFANYILDQIQQIVFLLSNNFNIRQEKQNVFLNTNYTEIQNRTFEKFLFFNHFILSNSILEENNLKVQTSLDNIWSSFKFTPHVNSIQLTIFSSIFLVYLFFINKYSTSVVLAYFYLWRKFELVRIFMNPSWNEHLNILFYNRDFSVSQQKQWDTYTIRGKNQIRKLVFFEWTENPWNKLLLTCVKSILDPQLLFDVKSFDLSRNQKGIGIQSFIKVQNKPNLFFNHNSQNKIGPGLKYSQIPFKNYNHSLNSVFKKTPHFYSYKNILFSFYFLCANKNINKKKSSSIQKKYIHNTTKEFNLSQYFPNQYRISYPIPLDLIYKNMKGLLLIGSSEDAKSYLVKNFSVDENLPLIHISINNLIHIQLDRKTDSTKHTKKKFIENIFNKFSFLIDLAKMLSPSIIWIPNLDNLFTNSLSNYEHFSKNGESNILLSILLKTISNEFSADWEHRITFIASSNNIRELDPAIFSPNGFDHLVYVRTPDIYKRKQAIVTLLLNQKLDLINNKLFDEIGNSTMGYTWQNLTALSNEISLIGITQKSHYINRYILRLAIHRQIFKANNVIVNSGHFSEYNVEDGSNPSLMIKNSYHITQKFSAKEEILRYKIGKAILQNKLIKSNYIFPIYLRQNLWKTKFYCLSKLYLQSSSTNTNITELTILPYILNCLGGSACRDAWLMSVYKKEQYSLSLVSTIEYDIQLASCLFGALFSELAYSDICNKNILIRNLLPIFNDTYLPCDLTVSETLTPKFNNLDKNNHLKNTLNFSTTRVPNLTWPNMLINISWSSRTLRFEVSRNAMFNNPEQNSTDNHFFNCLIQNNNKTELALDSLETKYLRYDPYRRGLLQIEYQQMKRLESQFDKILLRQKDSMIGFSITSLNLIEYKTFNDCIIFIAGMPVFTGIDLLNSRNIFSSYKDLPISKNIVSTLYLIYGNKLGRNRPRPIYKKKPSWLIENDNQKIKNTNQNKITLPIKKFNSVPEQITFDSFRSIVQIGSKLKRPQLNFPLYFYQTWTVQIPDQIYTHLYLSQKEKIFDKLQHVISTEMFLYRTLVESYHYLLRFFLLNNDIVVSTIDVLKKKNIMFEEDIEKEITIKIK